MDLFFFFFFFVFFFLSSRIPFFGGRCIVSAFRSVFGLLVSDSLSLGLAARLLGGIGCYCVASLAFAPMPA